MPAIATQLRTHQDHQGSQSEQLRTRGRILGEANERSPRALLFQRCRGVPVWECRT